MFRPRTIFHSGRFVFVLIHLYLGQTDMTFSGNVSRIQRNDHTCYD